MPMYNEFLRKVARITSDLEFVIPFGFTAVIGDDVITDQDDLEHECLTDLVYYSLKEEKPIYIYIDYDFSINLKYESKIKRMLQIGIMFDVYDDEEYNFSFYDGDDNPLDLNVIKPGEVDVERYVYSTNVFFNFLKKSTENHNVIIRINNNNKYYLK